MHSAGFDEHCPLCCHAVACGVLLACALAGLLGAALAAWKAMH